MTTEQRKHYFGHLWPAACLAHEWDIKDEARRRAVTAECMRLVGAPVTDSTSRLGPDEVTALFTYLAHLADQRSLEKSARWVTCQDDYRTFNRARQSDWHEVQTYGRTHQLRQTALGSGSSAAGGALDTLDPEEVRKRHLTMARRHQAKQRREKARQEGGSTAAPAAVEAGPKPEVEAPF